MIGQLIAYAIAAQGEAAALTVIGRALREAGVCILPLDKIAALAGVSCTTAQNAVRLAKKL